MRNRETKGFPHYRSRVRTPDGEGTHEGRWWIGVAAGMVLGLGAVVGVQASTDDASAQSGFTVTAEQLRINQRISQAAVRRSNEALDLLDPVRKSGTTDTAPGWGTTQIGDDAITRTKLDTTLREGQPRWAVVAATTGALVRGKNAVSSAKLATPGLYTVTFDRDVSACALQATIGDGGTTVTPTGADQRVAQRHRPEGRDGADRPTRTGAGPPTPCPSTWRCSASADSLQRSREDVRVR